MLDNLATAQEYAFHLAAILMVTVTLFRTDSGYAAIPESEYDGSPDHIIRDYDPFDA